MHRTCIALVDASRARILTLDRIADATGVRDELVEHEDLTNPARRTAPRSLFPERPGKAYAGTAPRDAEFAGAIVSRLAIHLADRRVTVLVVCASPHMLGELRHHVAPLHRPHLVIHELARELVELSPHQLQAQLATAGLLQHP